MDINLMQGLIGAGLGIVLFVMGLYKGRVQGVEITLQHMFDNGVLRTDEEGNLRAGPKLLEE